VGWLATDRPHQALPVTPTKPIATQEEGADINPNSSNPLVLFHKTNLGF
jgi:hypothetical protein